VAAHRIQTENQQTIEITDQTAQVDIIGQDEGGNPIDIHLVGSRAILLTLKIKIVLFNILII